MLKTIGSILFVALGIVVSALATAGQTTGTVAFTVLDTNQDMTTTQHIYLMDVNASGIGSNKRRLTTNGEAYSEVNPAWSPDGTKLVFDLSSTAPGINTIGSAICVINADGSNAQIRSNQPGAGQGTSHGLYSDTTPSWAPNGTLIVYAHLRQIPGSGPVYTDLRVVTATGTITDNALLSNVLFSVEPWWSVNNQIVFQGQIAGDTHLHVYVINSNGTGLTELTNDGFNNSDPRWSPDGNTISFGSNRDGGTNVNLYKMDKSGEIADPSSVKKLTNFVAPVPPPPLCGLPSDTCNTSCYPLGQASDTSWSQDGLKIAFEFDCGGETATLPNNYAEVYTMNSADGSARTATTVRCADAGCNPRWKFGPE